MTHDELLAVLNTGIVMTGKRLATHEEDALLYRKALRAVVEHHYPSGIFCRGCGFDEEYMEPAQLLPCPTIQLIEKELKELE